MKHLFNFLPTEKFRAKSSFLFRLIISMLYILPLLKAMIIGYEWMELSNLSRNLASFQSAIETHDKLNRSSTQFPVKEVQSKKNILIEKLKNFYRETGRTLFSWDNFFSDLEKVLPNDANILRISMKPDSALLVTIEGMAGSVKCVADFMDSLFKHERFQHPVLIRHVLQQDEKDSEKRDRIRFYLEVRYYSR
ncbi:MAG: PilN domain-containing protein [Candidatus Riflebacteria bacterium]|nr:PilN domain-containing protein [Candidatus Riflebacteria bacterium]